MRVKKFNERNKVVFQWEDSIQLGIVERVVLEKKSRRYEIRAESQQLFPIMGVDTKKDFPGKILSDLTEKYFKTKVIEEEIIETIIDSDD